MIDKLFLMLIELCNGKYLTADYLSDKLDVSKRSIYRYVDDLSLSNIPIISKQGNGGGYKIGEEYIIPNSYFSAAELNIIKTSILNLADSDRLMTVNSIMDKLNVTGIKENFAANRVSLIAYDGTQSNTLQGKLIALERAILKCNKVIINYHSRSGEVTSRSIAPLNFISHRNEWYIYCYCYMRDDYRTFKISRITHIDSLDIAHDIPAEYPQKWSFIDDKVQDIILILEVNKTVRYIVEEWLGIESITDIDGKLIAKSVVKEDDETISKVISLGVGVRVLSPPSVKFACSELIKQLYSQYND